VELVPVIAKVLDLLGGEAERRQVALERQLEPVPPVAGDEERIQQVLVNLCLNALEAVAPGGLVRVTCRLGPSDLEAPLDAPRTVEILVDDDGPGVSEPTRERIFEPFFTTKAKGSGLGLSIVHAIVAQHGGTIHVAESQEGGARFVLRLPRAG
jgi:signal transduction histidine kinase